MLAKITVFEAGGRLFRMSRPERACKLRTKKLYYRAQYLSRIACIFLFLQDTRCFVCSDALAFLPSNSRQLMVLTNLAHSDKLHCIGNLRLRSDALAAKWIFFNAVMSSRFEIARSSGLFERFIEFATSKQMTAVASRPKSSNDWNTL